MPTIDHSDYLDIRDLSQLAADCGDILEDEDSDEDEVTEAKETLVKLAAFAADRGHACNEEDAAEIEGALDSIGYNEPTLIADSYFEESCKELVTDCGYLPKDLPAFIESNIDWSGVADDLKADYTEVTLDGETYWHRDS
jgi:hypothetical protein